MSQFDVTEAPELLDPTVGASVSIQFSRRTAIETIVLHWGLVAGLVGLSAGWVWATTSTFSRPLVIVVAIQFSVALAATALSIRAVRAGHSYDQTDLWDGPTATLATCAVVAATVWTGGTLSAVWVLAIVAITYLASALVHELRWFVAAALVAAPWVVWTMTGDAGSRISLVFAAILCTALPVSYLMVRSLSRSLYDEAERVALGRAALDARVEELSHAMVSASEGRLNSELMAHTQPADGEEAAAIELLA